MLQLAHRFRLADTVSRFPRVSTPFTKDVKARNFYHELLRHCFNDQYLSLDEITRREATMKISSDKVPRKVRHNQGEYEVIREGLAEILQPIEQASSVGDKSQTVFYNHVQQFNRDLSVLAIRVFGHDYEVKRKLREGRPSTEGRRIEKRKRPQSDEGVRSEQEVKAIKHQTQDSSNENTHETQDPTDSAAQEGLKCKIQVGGNVKINETENFDPPTHPGADPKRIPSEIPPMESQNQFCLKILDALSASGLRALRYAKEIPQSTSITANDVSAAAAASITLNVQHNRVTNKVFPVTGYAQAHMYHIASQSNSRLPDGSYGKYHVIDLDPYGTATPYLDSAVQAAADGALLCVTCTDAGVFASAGYPEKTYSQYGGLPLRGPHAHEGGLRLVLHAVAASAARYGIAIEPLVSLSIDFYVRVFVRIRRSPSEVKLLAGKTMIVYSCDSGCGAWATQPIIRTQQRENRLGDNIYKFSIGQAPTTEQRCEHCGFKMHLGGPMWGGPLHNPFFIQRILDLIPSLDREVYPTLDRIEGMLSTARDETLLPDSISGREGMQTQTIATDDGSRKSLESEKCSSNVVVEGIQQTTIPIASLPPDMIDPHPFFILPSLLSKVLHTVAPSVPTLRSAFHGLGYRTTRSHTKPGSVRTDAPWTVVWEVMREWMRLHAPTKEGVRRDGTPGKGVMRWERTSSLWNVRAKLREIAEKAGGKEVVKRDLEALLYRLEMDEPNDTFDREEDVILEKSGKALESPGNAFTPSFSSLNVVFDEAKVKDIEVKKLVRYQNNPLPNWGPMSKARVPGPPS